MIREKIGSILFVAARPLGIKTLMDACDASREEVVTTLAELEQSFNDAGRGIRIVRHGEQVQMTTSPETAETVQAFLKDETTGELTKPSLETLTIVAYRGPITKAELEQIRGVNCSLILRNLMTRGLVETAGGEHGQPQTVYRVTMEFVRFLGISAIEELPEYEKLRSHENIARVLSVHAPKTTSEETQSIHE
jgi:segregation and condensation protein B